MISKILGTLSGLVVAYAIWLGGNAFLNHSELIDLRIENTKLQIELAELTIKKLKRG